MTDDDFGDDESEGRGNGDMVEGDDPGGNIVSLSDSLPSSCLGEIWIELLL